MRGAPVADEFAGAPQSRPGCMCREHIEPEESDGEFAPAPAAIGSTSGAFLCECIGDLMQVRTARIYVEYCFRTFGAMPVVVIPTTQSASSEG